MFGYIKSDIPEMKMWEYEAYRGVYCGLCRAMGKCTGCLSRLTLSYDFTFLVMIRCALTGEEIQFGTFVCPLHPLKKRVFMLPSDSLEYTARSCAVLVREKLRDDILDERGMKRFFARLASPLGVYFLKRANMPELAEKVGNRLSALNEAERGKTASVDIPADLFGEVMAEICTFGLSGSSERIGREIGRAVGRFIYIADALDDLFEDKSSGGYNPLILSYGEDAFVFDERHTEKVSDSLYKVQAGERGISLGRKNKKTLIPDSETAEMISLAMRLELRRLESAVGVLDFSGCRAFENIVENIVLSGMPKVITRLCGYNFF